MRHQIKTDRFCFTWPILLSVCLFAYACGSGGGGGGGVNTDPANASAASAATKSAIGSLSAFFDNPGTAKASLEGSSNKAGNDAELIRKGLEMLKANLRTQGRNHKLVQTATTSGPLPCELGGTEAFTFDDNNTPNNSFDDTSILTLVDCRSTEGPGVEVIEDGIEKIVFTGTSTAITGMAFTATNLKETFFDVSNPNNPKFLKEQSLNGTINIAGGTITACDPIEELDFFFTGVTATFNQTFREKKDEDGDGTIDKDELFTSTNFRMRFTDTGDIPTCNFSSTTIIQNGQTTFEDKLDPNSKDNITSTYSNYNITITWGDQAEMTTDGKVVIESSCASGQYTVSTVTPFLFPFGGVCPVEGKVLVQGGGNTSAVIANSDGSMDFDSNNNGTIDTATGDKHFVSCEDSNICD